MKNILILFILIFISNTSFAQFGMKSALTGEERIRLFAEPGGNVSVTTGQIAGLQNGLFSAINEANTFAVRKAFHDGFFLEGDTINFLDLEEFSTFPSGEVSLTEDGYYQSENFSFLTQSKIGVKGTDTITLSSYLYMDGSAIDLNTRINNLEKSRFLLNENGMTINQQVNGRTFDMQSDMSQGFYRLVKNGYNGINGNIINFEIDSSNVLTVNRKVSDNNSGYQLALDNPFQLHGNETGEFVQKVDAYGNTLGWILLDTLIGAGGGGAGDNNFVNGGLFDANIGRLILNREGLSDVVIDGFPTNTEGSQNLAETLTNGSTANGQNIDELGSLNFTDTNNDFQVWEMEEDIDGNFSIYEGSGADDNFKFIPNAVQTDPKAVLRQQDLDNYVTESALNLNYNSNSSGETLTLFPDGSNPIDLSETGTFTIPSNQIVNDSDSEAVFTTTNVHSSYKVAGNDIEVLLRFEITMINSSNGFLLSFNLPNNPVDLSVKKSNGTDEFTIGTTELVLKTPPTQRWASTLETGVAHSVATGGATSDLVTAYVSNSNTINPGVYYMTCRLKYSTTATLNN